MKRLLRFVIFAQLAPWVGVGLAADKKSSPSAPALDPDRIINDSMNFLKEREPEMTETEYALYEKVIPMISAQPDFALRLLEGMVADANSSAAFEFVLGNVYYEQKRLVDAEDHFKQAIEKFPTFARAWDNLGVLYFTSDRYAEAVPCFTKALVLGTSEPRLHGLLGFCLYKSGNPLAAEAAYLQAYALDPNNPDWIEGLLNAYLDTKQFPRAESLLRQLVRLKPREARYWLVLGNVLMSQDRKLDAIAEFETAKSLGALQNEGLMLLGDLYAEQKLLPEAVEVYQALAQSSAGLGLERLLRYAQALIGENALPEAEKVLAGIGDKVPDELRATVLQTRASLYQARNAWPEAQAQLEKLLELDPLNGEALLALGTVHETLGQEERAIIDYESAAHIPAVAYSANLKLANLQVRAQHYPEAEAAIAAAQSIQSSPALLEFHARVQGLVAKPE